MIELHINEPNEGKLVTLIDSTRLQGTIDENMPYVAIGTTFVVNGLVVATRR